jgi:sigma-E factor negative regulatory protein RseB
MQRLVMAFLLSVGAGICTADESEARSWLERMVEGARAVNYSGSFIYRHADRVDAMRIVHAAGEYGEREKLSSLTGPRREVIRDNREVTCILGDRQSVMVNKRRQRGPLPVHFPEDISSIERNYRFKLDGGDRVAGRPCQVVALVPRDAYRFGRRLCLDKENNLLLRSELTDDRGKVIELVMYTEIEFPENIADDALASDLDESGFRRTRQTDMAEAQAPVSAAESEWEVASVPEGFTLMDYMHHRMGKKALRVDHWVFGDGLANVSVYIEKAGPDENTYSGVSHRGGLSAYGTMTSGHHVTVVGEVPLATLELIGKSVRRKNQ